MKQVTTRLISSLHVFSFIQTFLLSRTSLFMNLPGIITYCLLSSLKMEKIHTNCIDVCALMAKCMALENRSIYTANLLGINIWHQEENAADTRYKHFWSVCYQKTLGTIHTSKSMFQTIQQCTQCNGQSPSVFRGRRQHGVALKSI